MSNWIDTDEPMETISRSDLLAILQALSLTDCDPRTLAIVMTMKAFGKTKKRYPFRKAGN